MRRCTYPRCEHRPVGSGPCPLGRIGECDANGGAWVGIQAAAAVLAAGWAVFGGYLLWLSFHVS